MLVLTTTLPARQGDGTPEFVLWLAQALRNDFEVHIVGPRVSGARAYENLDGVVIRRFAYSPNRRDGLADQAILPALRAQPWRVIEVPFLVAGLWITAIKTASRIRPAVVHAHWLVPSGLVALSLRWLLGIPYIVTVHGADAYALNSRLMRHLKRLITRHAHIVAPVSRDMGRVLGLASDDLERLVVPMGVDVEGIQREVGTRNPVHGKFVFIGRLADKKGVDVLLRAATTVPDARLVIVGDGPEAPRLRTLATELGIQQRVAFTGRQPRERVMDELRTAYAVVIPSTVGGGGDRDGTPLVVSEAMAAGVPVIASALGGLAEHVVPGETGLLVQAGSDASLAEGLRKALLAKEEVDRWGVNAKQRARGVLHIDSTVARYREFLESASGRSGIDVDSG
ncbi:MAG TPA: glycosyltransferase [Actinomycetota bacterium]|nr:glycosyltransferase [Actinomycetota bacterium]